MLLFAQFGNSITFIDNGAIVDGALIVYFVTCLVNYIIQHRLGICSFAIHISHDQQTKAKTTAI